MSVNNDPRVWGPPLWKKLHTITSNYPKKINNNNPDHIAIRNKVKKIFMDLKKEIPCKSCKYSYRKFIKQSPVDLHLHKGDSLDFWLYTLHNKVNVKLRKQETDRFNKAMLNLDEYSRINRISPVEYNNIKKRLKNQIIITGNDPTYEKVKKMYKNSHF